MRKVWVPVFLILILLVGPGILTAAVELPDLRKPTRIVADSDRLFVVDGASILIYSLKDFSLLRKFGGMGEGPGELKGLFSFLEIRGNQVLVYSPGRLSWFSRDGVFIRQKTDPSLGLNYRMVEEGFVGMKLVREPDGIYFGIFLFDANLKKVKEFYRYRHPFFGKRERGKVNAVEVRFSSYQVNADKIYLDQADGCIRVYDHRGEALRTICPALQKVPITAGHQKRFLDFWRTGLKEEYKVFGERLEFPDYFPLIRDFLVADGHLYVLTYREREENSELLVLDLQGKLQKRLWVPMQKVNPLLPHLFSLYTIHNHKLYILRDNEETETWEIEVTNLN